MRYRIDLRFSSPASFTHIPIFDGILYGIYCKWVLMTKEGRSYYMKGSDSFTKEHLDWIENLPILSVFPQPLQVKENEVLSYIGLPIRQNNGLLFSSNLQYEGVTEDTIRFRKRFRPKLSSIANFEGKIKKVRVNAGEYKSYDLPFASKEIENAHFIFESDYVDFVKYLFEMNNGIGKKRMRGLAQIESYSIIETTESIIRPIPLRNILDVIKKDFELQTRFETWKPPYFDLRYATDCIEGEI